MIILILGNNYSAKSFYNLFAQNSDNIVFSTIRECPNFIDFASNSDIVDFCEANAVNFVLITDNCYMASTLQEQISNMGISVFSPSAGASAICAAKSWAKRFMYKNKIKTPRFQIIEKPQLALDYIKTCKIPQAIKPDSCSFREGTKFCETFSQAQNLINSLFRSGNKKIIIEDYIEGKNISAWALSNGYSAKIILTSAKYQDEVAIANPLFINEKIKNQIQENFVNPTINALNKQDEEYIGILGFDFILTPNNQLYLLNYNSFFDDINVDFFSKGFDINWTDVFESVLVGDVFLKYDFENFENFMVTLRQNEKIKFISASTKTNLDIYLKELNYDLTLYNEAQKKWKY